MTLIEGNYMPNKQLETYALMDAFSSRPFSVLQGECPE